MAEPKIKYDINGALDDGYTYKDIASHLSEKNNYNLDEAIKDGYNYQEISEHLANLTPSNKKPEKQKSESYKKSRLDRDSQGNVIGSFDDDTFVGSTLNYLIPQPDKIPDQLMRQLGLTARTFSEGTAETADFVATPVRGSMNLLAKPFTDKPPIKPITNSTKDLLDELNVPFPEDRNERIVGGATKYIPLTGGPNLIIKATNPKSYVGKNIKESLLENQGKQLSSGALMGAGTQYAAEEDFGTLGQLGTGFGASVLPFLTKGKSMSTNFSPKPLYKKNLTKAEEIKQLKLTLDYESELAQTLKLGVDPKNAKFQTLKRLGLSEDKLSQAYINVSRPIKTFLNKNNELDYTAINTAILNKQKEVIKSPSLFTKITGNLTTRIKQYSTNIANRLRLSDFNEQSKVARKIETVEPFIKNLNQIKKKNPAQYKQLQLDLFNGNHNNVSKIMQDISPDALQAWKNTEAMLNSTRNDLLQSGFNINKIKNYFPRSVTDVKLLYRGLNIEQKNIIDLMLNNKLLNNRAAAILKKDNKLTKDDAITLAKTQIKEENLDANTALSADEISDIYDNFLRGYGTSKLKLGSPSFTKQRTMGELTETELPYYDDAGENLLNYIRSTQKQIEHRRFFGEDIPMSFGRNDKGEANESLILDSIGKLFKKENDIRQANNQPKLTTDEMNELKSLLLSRFGKGEQPSGKFVATLKDIMYTLTLANPFSAGTQLGDISQTAFQMNVKKAVGALLTTKQAKLKDLGLDNTVNADLTKESRLSSKLLDKLLGANFFKRVDKIGKETNMNAALKEGQALAKNSKGLKILEKKWKNVFGNEYDNFIKDLKSGDLTDNVKYYLWHNLADQQPISLSEMPQMYLDLPNGRAFYALQSFALKQLDVIKRNILDEYKNGNKKKAVVNATRYSLIVGGGNTLVDYGKDVALGREIDPYNIPKDILFNTIKVFGVNEYAYDKFLKTGEVDEWVNSMWMPPIGVVAAPAADAMKLIQKALDPDEEITMQDLYNLQTTRRAPFVGSLVQNYLGGGRERYNEEIDDKRTDNIFGIE